MRFKEYLENVMPDYNDFRHPQMKNWLDANTKNQDYEWSSFPPGKNPMSGDRNYEAIDGWMCGVLMSQDRSHATMRGYVFSGITTNEYTGQTGSVEYDAYVGNMEYIESFSTLTLAMRAVMDRVNKS